MNILQKIYWFLIGMIDLRYIDHILYLIICGIIYIDDNEKYIVSNNLFDIIFL